MFVQYCNPLMDSMVFNAYRFPDSNKELLLGSLKTRFLSYLGRTPMNKIPLKYIMTTPN
jgi:hypothetical protein